MNKPILTEEELRSNKYSRFYCKTCKGYVLFKSSYGKRFCKNCNGVIE